MIAVEADNLSPQAKAHFSHNLFVPVEAEEGKKRMGEQANPKQGLLRVCSRLNGLPLPSSYVKVFAQLTNGRVVFYKDGYTDLRGIFDFESLCVDIVQQVSKYSVLVIRSV